MRVYLYKVGRNLNRAYRTCESFGVEELALIQCAGEVTGQLFSAEGRLNVIRRESLPDPSGLLAVETSYKTPIWDVDWNTIGAIILGGESDSLPRMDASVKATIPTIGHLNVLTVEAALAIVLYEWRKSIIR